MIARTTTKLPLDWRPVVAVPPPSGPKTPAPSKAMIAAGRSMTEPMPVIGRAGTRERVRAGDACFGGSEASS